MYYKKQKIGNKWYPRSLTVGTYDTKDVADRLSEMSTVSKGDTYTVLIPASQIYPNTPTKLQFMLPAEVTEGQWEVSVTTQSSSSSVLLKQPRTGVYEDIVTVGDASGDDDDGPVIH